MIDFLNTIFGDHITIAEFHYPDATPYYIKDGYHAQSLSWNKNTCVLLTPNTVSWRLPTLKKQLLNFQEICPIPCALCLENLSAMQRRNLIENHIPFLSLSQQVYLPFWGCSFLEKFKAEIAIADKMAPGTQLVFLYLYYLQNIERINLTHLSNALMISKATCTRAIDDLTASGLITLETEGTNKWISLSFEKTEFLKKAYPRLKSPIERVIFAKKTTELPAQPQSGMLALATLSMVSANEEDGAIAISKKTAAQIQPEHLLSQQEFWDFGGTVVEVWNYDPLPLAQNGQVDDISLLLSLEMISNERVQMGLDEIREKHQLPINDEE